ncbi:hypothetical protein D3C84_783090 [compost metagenome]
MVIAYGTAIEHQPLFARDHVQYRLVRRCPDIFFHPRQMSRCLQGAFLAGDDAVLHHRLDHGIRGSQITFQILFISRANIQCSAQRLELLDRYSQLLYFKVPLRIGFTDKGRVGGKYFTFGKIMQRR